VRATESALKRMTAERDGLARELAELKARAGGAPETPHQSLLGEWGAGSEGGGCGRRNDILARPSLPVIFIAVLRIPLSSLLPSDTIVS